MADLTPSNRRLLVLRERMMRRQNTKKVAVTEHT
jgi:hypothetical protein